MIKKSIIVSNKKWNDEYIKKFIKKNKTFYHVKSIRELSIILKNVSPDFIFFIHWSKYIKKNIYDKYECINFHMTDLPFGRGGSPLQNLILLGFKKTFLTAHKVSATIDSGDIYLKRRLSLKGNAKEIYIRSTEITLKMIKFIINNKIKVKNQIGNITYFKQRQPKQSEIDFKKDLEKIYDFIRMLDAPKYPKANLKLKKFNIEFFGAKIKNKSIFTSARIYGNKK